MKGDTIIARFDSLVGTDTASRPRIREIVAEGNASSFYQMKNSKGPQTQPTVNYVRGRIIDIIFEDRKVSTVTVTEKATGTTKKALKDACSQVEEQEDGLKIEGGAKLRAALPPNMLYEQQSAAPA